ncbi:MAG: YggU family protein [Acidobacteria bacterium]|nr:YggU family protein [Acidobacteriota bacterium]
MKETTEYIEFLVRVVPRASRTEIVGELDGALKVRISSPPVDGAANAEIIKFLAKTFGLAKSNIEIVSGQASKAKRIRITGVTAEQARRSFGQ